MSIVLQNVIFYPHSLELSHLYVRGNNYALLNNETIKIKAYNSIAFDTYFNFFSIEKWLRYCSLDNLYLEFSFKGNIQINLIGLDYRHTFYQYEQDLHQEILSSDKEKHHKIRIDQFNMHKVLYVSVRANDVDSIISNICFTTESEVVNKEYKLSCCICTYNRQSYIQKSADVLETGIDQNRLNMDVIITNNGDPIQLNKEYKNIHIYKSKNMGGAGGFTHSICKAMESNSSHVLLMDDDINFHFESLLRTYRFFQFIRPEYFDVMLAGSMFSSDERWLQYERNTILDNNGFHHQGHFQDMRDRGVALNNTFSESIYGLSGWWFSAFSTKLIKENGLPLPFFVRGDDIEFSMRNNKEIVSLNGINVWHDPFILKYNEIMEDYYLPRNMIMNALLSYQRYYNLIKLFSLKKFIKNLITFNYVAAEFNVLALEHVINEEYKKDPADLHQWAMKTLKELKKNTVTVSDVDYYYTEPRFHKKSTKLLGIILSYLGLGTEGSSKYGFERQPIFFYGRKKVRLFNTLNRTMEEATLQRGKSIRLAIRFVKNYIHLIRNIESYRSKLLEFREHSKENASWDKLFSSQNEK